MKKLLQFFFFSVLVLMTSESFSQSFSLPADGKDFWVGYMNPSYNKVANATTLGYYGAYLLISSYSNNTITVSYFDRTTGVEFVSGIYKIPERSGIQIPLNLIQ